MTDHDRILKESIKDTLEPLIRRILAIPVRDMEQLNTDLPVTDERKPDFLIRVDSTEGESPGRTPFIIHIEFQTANDPIMHYRMLRYRSYLAQTYRLPVRQFVIFIGESPVRMADSIIDNDLSFRYGIISLQAIDCAPFLDSDNPEEIVLALLCRPLEGDRRLTIRRILNNLKTKAKGELAFGKYTRQLEILSRLRKAQQTVLEEMKHMAITFDVNEDPLYRDGVSQGVILGLKQSRIETAHKMKEEGLDSAVIAKITGLSPEEIEKA